MKNTGTEKTHFSFPQKFSTVTLKAVIRKESELIRIRNMINTLFKAF